MLRFSRSLLSPSGSGRLRSSRQNFLSFHEARDFVRALKLNGVKDWERWRSSGQRPLHIPSDPSKIYATSGWKGFPDFFGYEKYTKNDAEIECAHRDLHARRGQVPLRCSSHQMSHDACDRFVQELVPSSIEIKRLPLACQAQIAYRPRGTGGGLWAPLFVRSASRKSPSIQGDTVSFKRPPSGSIAGGMVCVIFDEKQDRAPLFLFLSSDSLIMLQERLSPNTTKLYFRLSSVGVYKTISAQVEVEHLLAYQYQSSSASHIAEDDILKKWIRCRRQKLHETLAQQLISKLYTQSPSLGFQKSTFMPGSICDGVVAEKKVFHASVGTWNDARGRRAFRITLTKWHPGNLHLSLHVGDDFDFVVGMCPQAVESGTGILHGVYIIPKEVIRTALASDGQRGSGQIHFFLPDFLVHRPSSVKKKAQQLRFFIDLSQDTTPAEQIRKAEQIFAGEWEGRGGDDDPCF